MPTEVVDIYVIAVIAHPSQLGHADFQLPSAVCSQLLARLITI
jgi:hypothetical protein